MNNHRVIETVSRSISSQLRDCLASVLSAELMNPSEKLFLMSGWVSDIPVLTNRFGELRAFIPDTTVHQLRLSAYLNRLAELGTSIYILVREAKHNYDFLDRINQSLIHVKLRPAFHQKTLVCDHFYIHGSMNFTWTGIQNDDETFNLETDEKRISHALINAEQTWKDKE